VPTISTELLFDDVHRQLVAFTELVPTEQVEPGGKKIAGMTEQSVVATGLIFVPA